MDGCGYDVITIGRLESSTCLHSLVDARIEGTALAMPRANADSYPHIIPKQQSQDKEAMSANVLELNITE